MSITARLRAVARVLLAHDGAIDSVNKLFPAGDYRSAKLQMIRQHLIPRGVDEFLVLAAMYKVRSSQVRATGSGRRCLHRLPVASVGRADD